MTRQINKEAKVARFQKHQKKQKQPKIFSQAKSSFKLKTDSYIEEQQKVNAESKSNEYETSSMNVASTITRDDISSTAIGDTTITRDDISSTAIGDTTIIRDDISATAIDDTTIIRDDISATAIDDTTITRIDSTIKDSYVLNQNKVIVTVDRLSNKGEGVAFYQDKELYIHDVLPHEVLEVEVLDPFAKGSKRCPAIVKQILKPANERVVPFCPHFSQCGGCQLMHLSYESQLKQKEADIRDAVAEVVENLPQNFQKDIDLEDILKPIVACKSAQIQATNFIRQKCNIESNSNTNNNLRTNTSNNSSKKTYTSYETTKSVCRYKTIRYFANVPVEKDGTFQHKDISRHNSSNSSNSSNHSKLIDSSAGNNNLIATKLVAGFYAPRSHDLVPVIHCPLEPISFSKVITEFCSVLNNFGIKAYDQVEAKQNPKQAQVRALMLRQGDNETELLAFLIVSAPLSQEIKQELIKVAFRLDIKCVVVGINAQDGNALFTSDLEYLTSEHCIKKDILGNSFKVDANTFLQVNYEICSKLYQQAIAHCLKSNTSIDRLTKSHNTLSSMSHEELVLKEHNILENNCCNSTNSNSCNCSNINNTSAGVESSQKNNIALDLCCGVGTMSLALAKHFKHVVAVDIVDNSIKAARENAVCNNISNVNFIAADITKVIPSLIQTTTTKFKNKTNNLKEDSLKTDSLILSQVNSRHMSKSVVKAIIADPARAGLGEKNAKELCKLEHCQLSMIFCSLTALKRDLKILLKNGYKLKSIQGFDMFPHSKHVETLVLLSK